MICIILMVWFRYCSTSSRQVPMHVATLMHLIPNFSNIFCVGTSTEETSTLCGSSISTFIEIHLEVIHRGCESGITGCGASTICTSEEPSLQIYTLCYSNTAACIVMTFFGMKLSCTFHPALWNMSSWWHCHSGLAMTRPGPIMLKVASICMGLGSLKLRVWILYLLPRCRFIQSIPNLLVTYIYMYI